MSAALQDALARMDALVAKWRTVSARWAEKAAAVDGPADAAGQTTFRVKFEDALIGGMIDLAADALARELSAIRAAHDIPSQTPIPPSAPLPAAADTGRALSCDGVRPTFSGDKEKGGNAEARRQGD